MNFFSFLLLLLLTFLRQLTSMIQVKHGDTLWNGSLPIPTLFYSGLQMTSPDSNCPLPLNISGCSGSCGHQWLPVISDVNWWSQVISLSTIWRGSVWMIPGMADWPSSCVLPQATLPDISQPRFYPASCFNFSPHHLKMRIFTCQVKERTV